MYKVLIERFTIIGKLVKYYIAYLFVTIFKEVLIETDADFKKRFGGKDDDQAVDATKAAPVKVGTPKLNCAQVKAIKKESANGMSDVELGSLYGVSRSTINRIITGKTYKNCLDESL